MADQELQRMQELLAQVNREYEQMGRVLPQTQHQMSSAASGVKNLDMQMDLAGTAVKALTGAFLDYNKAVYNGERGTRAFNRGVEGMATAVQAASAALALLIPGGALIKGVVAGLGYLAGEAMKASTVIGEQADATFDTYQKLAESGALAGDGMNGVFEGLQKMGLGVQEAASYIGLFNQNAQTMAQFGTTVGRGRKLFENTVAEMQPFREQLQALGLNQEAQNDATMTFVKIQNRLNSQTRDNTAITGAAAVAYIKEMDAITKITGMSRKQQEEALDQAMRHQRFGAVIDELMAQDRVKEAKQLQLAFRLAAAQGQDLGDAFMAASSGLIDDESARKGLISSQGELMNVIDRITSGQIRNNDELAANMQVLFKSIADTSTDLRSLDLLGIGEDTMLSYATRANVQKVAVNNFVEMLGKAQDEINTQVGENGKKQEQLLSDYARMVVSLQETMLAQQALVQMSTDSYVKIAADTAQSNEALAKAALRAARALNEMGLGADATKTQIQEQDDVNLESMTLWEKTTTRLIRTGDSLWRGVADVVGLFSEETQKTIDEMTDSREKLRVQNQIAMLESEGRFIPAEDYAVNTGVRPPGPVRMAADAVPKTRESLIKNAGLRVKEGDVQKENAGVSAKLIELAKQIQSSIPGFSQFTSFNDRFHNEKAPASRHTAGLALDFTLENPPSREQARKIVSELKKMGASYVLDEYNFPSPNSTGGHFHVEVALAKGGLVQQPTVALVGEKGPEAVVPLNRMFTEFDRMLNVSQSSIKDSTDEIRLTLDRALSELQPNDTPTATGVDMQDVVTQAMSRMTRENNAAITGGFEALIAEVRNLVGVNKNVVDIQEKILRMQS